MRTQMLATALVVASAAVATATTLSDCHSTLLTCLGDSGAIFDIGRRRSDDSAIGVVCGCQKSSTSTTYGGCSCYCSCMNQFYVCYYDNVNKDVAAAMNSLTDIITSDNNDYNFTDYSPTDCLPNTIYTSSDWIGESAGEGQGGKAEDGSSEEEISVVFDDEWCYFQIYGDPHFVKAYSGTDFLWWTCMETSFTSLYKSSTLQVNAVASNLAGADTISYPTEVSFVISDTTYTVKATTMQFSPSTPPKGFVFGACNKTVKNTPLEDIDTTKCIAMFSNSGEFMSFLQDGDATTGYFLMVDIYGPCSGDGLLQGEEESCPSTGRAVTAREVPRSSALCKGLSSPYSDICNFDVSRSGVDSTSTSSFYASNGAEMAASYFAAIKSIGGGAAAAGLSTAAITGIAVGSGVAAIAVVGAATVAAVKLVKKPAKESEKPVPMERKKPAFSGAGPNVMDPDPLSHTSITARAAPVQV